ncbi:MAG: hypothetical protein P8N76_12150 [Pirellulaceae bacterium]|nr:hypothetical protein [Pirellulaceae bacterium]
MRFQRGGWVVGSLVMLGLLAAVWAFWPYRLPHPDVCDQDQLYRWMALRDLSEEPRDIQISLVGRFQDLMEEQRLGESVEIDPRYESRVTANRKVLQDLWFQDAIEQFNLLPVNQRAEFLDRQIGTIQGWRAMSGNSDWHEGSHAIGTQLNVWLVSEDETARVVSTLAAGFLRWLATHDLSDVSLQSREQVVGMLADALETRELNSVSESLPGQLSTVLPEDTDLLTANGELLLEAWYYLQARRHWALPVDARADFVVEQVNRVKTSPLIPLLMASDSTDSVTNQNPLFAAMKMLQTVDRWIQRADATDHEMLSQFKLAVQQQLLKSRFPWMKLQP